MRLGSLMGQHWSAEGIEVQLDLQGSNEIGLRLGVTRASFGELAEPMRDLQIRCPEALFHESSLTCEEGRLYLQHPLLEQPESGLSFAWDKATASLDLQLRDLAAGGGKSSIAVRRDPQRWALRMDGRGLSLARLKAMSKALGIELPPWEVKGRVDLKLQLEGVGEGPDSLSWQAGLQGVGFSGPQGGYLGEGLSGAWRGRLRLRGDSWRGSSVLTLNRGELLTPAFYLAAEPQQVSLSTEIRYHATRQQLRLTGVEYRHEAVFDVDAEIHLAVTEQEPLQHLELRSAGIPLDALYRRYLQPVLAEGVAARLETAGDIRLKLSYRAGGPSRLEVDLQDIHLDGAQVSATEQLDPPSPGPFRPFGLYGLNGRLVWTTGTGAEVSELRWAGGHILEVVDLGPAVVRLGIGENRLELLEETTIPVLDGSLLVTAFSLAPGTGDSGRVGFEGVLAPISLQPLSVALGWPPLSGKLSGVIPSVSFEDGILEVNGNLLLRIFDGEVLVRNLRMEDLFGIWPVVTADLELRNLDLEALTGAFAFGKITGRLEGRITELRLENWVPVAFDARFATPESDRSPHRISQRAVDNISDLGGAGVSGAVSRSFLRYFDEFGYKRLGISCRLRQGVCEMGGVAPAGDGYYLVEGGGIPRIGIVGYTRRTDWNRLVTQLKEIAAGTGAPVIQ